MKPFYKISYLLSSVLLFTGIFSARSQMITFEKHYPTSFDQSGKDVYPTADGGYLVAATTENTVTDDLNIILVKTNSYGDIQSIKTYGGNQVDFPNDILPTSDGNFFVVGYTRSHGPGDQDIYLLKVNQSGDTIFTRRYGGFGNEEGKEIIATADGNYVIVGATTSVGSDSQMELMKINSNGDVIWTKYYGTPQYESSRSVRLCSDGGFIVAGKTCPNLLDKANAMLVRTNSSGDTLWTRVISGGANSYEGKSVVANSDGTFTFAIDDSSAATDSDIKVMKLNSTATSVIWSKPFGGNLKDICKHIRPTSDGGYIMGAISRSFGWVNPEVWVIKLDANGDEQWDRHYGGTGHDHLHSARTTPDGGYIVTGHARSFAPTWEIYLLKLDASGVVGLNELLAENKLSVYPNPSDGMITIDMSERNDLVAFTISNSLGQAIHSENTMGLRGNKMVTIDLKNNLPGMYYITFQTSTQSVTKKLILN